jgi:hypothetical protein
MKKLLVLMAVVLLASGAMAQIDPDDNGMGVYFDTEGTVVCKTTAAPFESVNAYLLITRPTDTAGVSGWEAAVTIGGAPVAPSWALAAGLDVDSSASGFQVGIGVAPAALPAAPAVLLATWTGFVMQPTDVVTFTVSDVPGSVSFDGTPGYGSGADAGLLIPLQVSTGFPYVVCAQINGACDIVANDEMSWSSVKTMFQ